MMKKLMIACAIMTLAVGARASDNGVFEKTVAIGAAATVYTNYVDLGADTFKDVLKITFINATAATATTVTATEDIGVWTTIDTSAVTTGSTGVVYPTRTFTEVATGGYYETNDVLVATTITTTKKDLYPAKRLRLITTLNGTNGTANATGFKFSIYSK